MVGIVQRMDMYVQARSLHLAIQTPLTQTWLFLSLTLSCISFLVKGHIIRVSSYSLPTSSSWVILSSPLLMELEAVILIQTTTPITPTQIDLTIQMALVDDGVKRQAMACSMIVKK